MTKDTVTLFNTFVPDSTLFIFSRDGNVAWYSCYLDDISEWDGQKGGWRNVRWTGVLERREGKWLIMQMHFSFPVERFK
jgi:hypothetical protein